MTIVLACSLPDYGFLDPQRVHCTIWLYRLQHQPHPKPPCDTCNTIYVCMSYSAPVWLVRSL